MMEPIERIGDPINVTYIAGGRASSTWHRRRVLVITALVEEGSLEIYKWSPEMATKFGADLGRAVHEVLRTTNEAY